jgi:hypothetical protein
MTFQIEKNIPIPKISAGRGRIYPFPEMKVGDSFAVPITKETSFSKSKNTAAVRSSAIAYARKYGGKFSVKFDSTDEVIRCWRVG